MEINSKIRNLKYEVIFNDTSIEVKSLKEAENKLKSIGRSEFDMCYILIKEYDKDGKLIETWYTN